jgi:DNA-binding NarL/FixJ family response regulator
MENKPSSDSDVAIASATGTVRAPAGAAPAQDVLRVVLVDDSLPVRERVAASLAAVEGVEVVGQAGDVPSGLRLLEQCKPDVLILDLELPGQSGLELLVACRRAKHAAIIIMFSIHDEMKLREKCLEMGAAFYFNKASEFDHAIEVCRYLSSHRPRQS